MKLSLRVQSAFSLASGSVAFARLFTVYNGCPFTVWPAIYTDLSVATNVPIYTTGWEAAPYSAVSFPVPDNWKAGRIWGRRDCNFTTNSGPNSCLDGGCNGGLVCDSQNGTGMPPATLAEFTLQGANWNDYYDVSVVDGFNLPLKVTNNVNCSIADCPVDLDADCPTPIQGPFDSSGFAVGCKSACQANLDGNPSDSANCCTGSYNTAATCPSSEDNCPNSYVYAYDESSGTALWTCDSGLNADFTITFCP